MKKYLPLIGVLAIVLFSGVSFFGSGEKMGGGSFIVLANNDLDTTFVIEAYNGDNFRAQRISVMAAGDSFLVCIIGINGQRIDSLWAYPLEASGVPLNIPADAESLRIKRPGTEAANAVARLNWAALRS